MRAPPQSSNRAKCLMRGGFSALHATPEGTGTFLEMERHQPTLGVTRWT